MSAKELAAALRELSAFEEHTIRSFSEVDVVLTPGLATAPPTIGFYDSEDPERNFLQQVQVTPYSSFVNVSGLPALALPVMLNPEGLPVGIQMIGRPGGDATLLQLGAQLEDALEFPSWALQLPRKQSPREKKCAEDVGKVWIASSEGVFTLLR